MALKHLSLVVLTIQNSALILTMRYSRIMPGPRYRATTAVVLSECLKSLLSFIVLLGTSSRHADDDVSKNIVPSSRSTTQCVRYALSAVFSTKGGLVSILLPAILYTIQNNLQYQAATNLDAATFQTTYQGKILATAFFAVLILQQKLTCMKWLAIVVLTAGVVLISYPAGVGAKWGRAHKQEGNRSIGLAAVGAACLTSGLAGVYLEHILKRVKDSRTANGLSMLWVRNLQLCLASIVMAAVATVVADGPKILVDGFLYGYNPVVWATILLQAGGGFVVALVIIYADNILKNFATTISTVISSAVSVLTGDCVMTMPLAAGIFLVLMATNLYGASSCFQDRHIDDGDRRANLDSNVKCKLKEPEKGDVELGSSKEQRLT